MVGNALQHIERPRCFLLRQKVDLQLNMIAPGGSAVDGVLPDQERREQRKWIRGDGLMRAMHNVKRDPDAHC